MNLIKTVIGVGYQYALPGERMGGIKNAPDKEDAVLQCPDLCSLMAFVVVYFCFMMPSLYVDYAKKDDLKSVAFADEAGTEALTWIKDLTQYMNPDFMSQSWSEAFANVFGEGKAAFGVYRSSQTDETMFAETILT